ncbi:unnamed protein product [Cochlearia groenlandica]
MVWVDMEAGYKSRMVQRMVGKRVRMEYERLKHGMVSRLMDRRSSCKRKACKRFVLVSPSKEESQQRSF